MVQVTGAVTTEKPKQDKSVSALTKKTKDTSKHSTKPIEGKVKK